MMHSSQPATWASTEDGVSDRKKGERRENPRTKRVREIVLAEGVELLTSDGGQAVTAARIAERTGVSRTTIYRHWPSQPALLLDVVERGMVPHRTTELTGDLARDLHAVLLNLRVRIRKQPFRRVFATLLAQANGDEAFIGPQQRLVEGVLSPIREVLLDAVSRDALPPTFDVDSACAQLAGPLLLQHVMLRAPITNALITRVVQGFLSR